MLNTKTIIILLLTAFAGLGLSAQTSISGKVLDVEGESLVGANIYLEGTYDGASSNADGEFILSTSELGVQVLCIDFIGFEKHKKELLLEGSSIELNSIELIEVFNELTAVTITAGTFEAGDKKKSIAMSSLDMLTTAGAAGDVYGALQTLPGTTTVGESGKLFVKGGHSRESKTFIDGMLVHVPYSSSSPNNSVRGRFSPFMFSGMMFSTGGYSAEYGQALSSVLALQTNAMPVQDQLNISLLSVGAELGGTKTWDNTSVTSTFEYNNLGPYMSLVPQNTQWDKEPQSLTGNLSFRLKTGKSGMLKIFATANQTSLSTIEDRLEEPESNFRFRLKNENIFINTSWIGEIKKDWILTAGFSYTDNIDKVTVDSMNINKHLKGKHAKVSLKHRVSEQIRVISGAELISKQYAMDFPMLNDLESVAFSNNTLAGFIESELYASPKFVSRLGARFEYSDYLNKASIAPRISTAYKLNDKGQVSLSYGWFFQDPEDDFLLYSDGFEFERADHYTLNYMRKEDRRMLRAELYAKKYKNLVKYGVGESNEYEYFNNQGDGSVYGFDLFWRDRKSLRNAEYWVSYSFADTKRDYHDYPYEAIPGYSSKHNLTLVYKHWFSRIRSQLGGTYRISSPRYYNNPNKEIFNNETTIAYQSLDLNWSYLHKQNVIFYFSVSNVLGFEQQFGYEYSTIPDENGVYQSSPILPGARRFFVLGCFITLSKSGNINQLDKIN